MFGEGEKEQKERVRVPPRRSEGKMRLGRISSERQEKWGVTSEREGKSRKGEKLMAERIAHVRPTGSELLQNPKRWRWVGDAAYLYPEVHLSVPLGAPGNDTHQDRRQCATGRLRLRLVYALRKPVANHTTGRGCSFISWDPLYGPGQHPSP